MKTHAIVGLGFGDEGKGKVTDFLCSRNSDPIVARFSGGQQAGHMVMKEGHSHVFSNFGSGTLKYIPTYWSKYCTVDPVGIVNEYQILKDKGYNPELFIDPRCPITTPFDKLCNQNSSLINKNGSCGVGVGTTFKREENFYSLLFEDLFFPSIVEMKLNLIRDYYCYNINDVTDKFLEDFLYCCKFIRSKNFIFKRNQKIITDYFSIIFEGSQGLLLDQHYGFFPHCTPSNVGTKNIIEIGYEPEVWLVTRAYQTRHGNGPMTNEDREFKINNKYEHNTTHEYQGEFRTSMLDLDLLKYAIMKDEYINIHRDNLVINHLDCLEEFKLTHKGELLSFEDKNRFVNYIANKLNVRNVYMSSSPYSNDIIQYTGEM